MGVVLYAAVTVVAFLAHLRWEEGATEDVTSTLVKACSWPATALILTFVGCVRVVRRFIG